MSDRKITVGEEVAAVGRAVVLYLQAAPVAGPLHFAMHALGGLGAPVSFAAVGVLVAAVTADPGPTAGVALGIGMLAAVAIWSDANAAMFYLLDSRTNERLTAHLERELMRAVAAPRGIAHLEDARAADLLKVASWARDEPRRLSRLVTAIPFWLAEAAGTAIIVSRIAWWAPLLLLAAAIPDGIHSWRSAGRERGAMIAGTEELRRADWFRQLAFDVRASKELRVFGLASWVASNQEQHWRRGVAAALRVARRRLTGELALAAVSALGCAVPVAFAFHLAGQGRIGLGELSAAVLSILYLARSTGSATWLPARLRTASRFLPTWRRVVRDLTPEPADPNDVRRAQTAPEVRFENVTFAYPGTRQPVLRGLDLVVPAGTSLALVGENGCGKSTIVKLLCGFYEPDAGRVLVGGRDASTGHPDVAAVFQDFAHWPLSARDNVGFGRADQPTLTDAGRRAGADSVVGRLPNGWDTILSRDLGGVDLSGGEWQRIALARCLAGQALLGAGVLVLDEPTAAMDVRVEHDLYQRFADVTAGCTTILISHRLSTTRLADRIAVVEHGAVVELGTHDDLIRAGGRYAELFELQARRFAQTGGIE